MKLSRIAASASMVGMLSMASSGIALADSVDVSTTGPGSTNVATVTNSNEVEVTNTNNVNVVNSSTQNATSGAATSSFNTIGGGATSGSASNSNTTTTAVSIANSGICGTCLVGGGNVTPGGGTTPVGGGGQGGSTGGQGGGSASPLGGQGGGSTSSLGGQGGGVATLPEVGASVPMDVSALRALYNPEESTPTIVKNARDMSGLLLAGASLLSFLGAGGAAYATRRHKQV